MALGVVRGERQGKARFRRAPSIGRTVEALRAIRGRRQAVTGAAELTVARGPKRAG